MAELDKFGIYRSGEMDIQLANESDLDIIKKITNTTIKEIYPHYYPEGAVAFFLNHHNYNN